uniref:Uncharacterized protein n=1 Tax=Psilocybe cubensis TaxID=181762 RepID=A0A8H7XU41_PSICU
MLVIEHIAKLFLLLVALFAVHASAAPRANVSPALDNRNLVTNAARLRAGLGPLKPRSLYSPSRVGARSPTKSVVPVGGTIKVVRKSNRAEVGYVSKNAGSTGFGINTSPSDKLSVTFTPSSSPFNIAITGNNYPYLGFAGGNLCVSGILYHRRFFE